MDLDELLAPLQAATAQVEAILGLPEPWLRGAPGPEHWSAVDVAAHMATVEETAWLPRIRHVLERGTSSPMPAVDPAGFVQRFPDRDPGAIAAAFAAARRANLAQLPALALTADALERRGVHQRFGEVSLRELMATWVAHDLNHLAQAHEVLAAALHDRVGPWRAFVPIVDRLVD